MPDTTRATDLATSAGFAHAAEAFADEINAAFTTAVTLRAAIIRPDDAAIEPTPAYRVNRDTVTS